MNQLLWWYVTANGQFIAQFYADDISRQAIIGAIKSFPGVSNVKAYYYGNGAWTDMDQAILASARQA